MINPDHPLPASGGSYMRNADGSLTRINEEGQPIDDEGNVIDAAPADAPAEVAAPDPVPAKPTRAVRSSTAADAALTEKEV
ncbi:hypothetical protein GCM10010873_16540 [Cypionkella aquatica]|uniref:Uncharacterized protein n=1 Tax=Cypionkella aquatica TaxID=1756042 RepID=A0AA37U373_9RHOB|nr:hypothetical protein [Cypionkella aquatica]GLS86680.1 hypothetical protein GCM10010873_16540 [Cypionkella aquatica]